MSNPDPWAAYVPVQAQPSPGPAPGRQDPWSAYSTAPPAGATRAAASGEPFGDRALRSIGDAASGAAQWASDLWTGNDRRQFDYPELPPIKIEGDGLTSTKMALGRDDVRKLDILRHMAGNLPAELDDYGNVFVTIDALTAKRLSSAVTPVQPGRYYLNRPGRSLQDIDDLVTGSIVMGTETLIGARAGGRAAGGRGGSGTGPARYAGRPAGAALGAGLGSATQDLLASAAGSERGVDPAAALVAAGFGLGGELAAGVVAPFIGRLIRNPAMWAAGKLTRAGEFALRRAGLDPAALTPAFVERFRQLAVQAADPHAAAAAAAGQTLPVPVRLSRGDVSRDVAQQGFEDAAELGQLGRPAQEVMTGFRQGQQQELQANLPAIQGRLGGGQATVTEPGEGMARVQQRLLGDAEAARAGVNQAYDAARAASGGLDAGAVDQAGQRMLGQLRERFTPGTTPTAEAVLKDFADVTRGSGVAELAAAEKAGQGPATTLIRRLEEWRQRASRALRSAADRSPDQAAIADLIRQYDELAESQIEGALFRGDADALALWQKARGLRREFAEKFESNGIVKRLIQTDPQSGRMVLTATPTEALNYLFTASGAGGKVGAAKAISQLRTLLGPESPEWAALKQEAFLRLLRSQGKGNNLDAALQPIFSGSKFATALDDAMRGSPEVMRILYGAEDLALLQQFKQVALRATNRVRGATNPSGTGGRVALLAQQMVQAGIIGRVGYAVLGKAFGWLGQGMDAAAARAATSGRLPPRDVIPPGWGGSLGARIGSEQFERKQVQQRDLRDRQ